MAQLSPSGSAPRSDGPPERRPIFWDIVNRAMTDWGYTLRFAFLTIVLATVVLGGTAGVFLVVVTHTNMSADFGAAAAQMSSTLNHDSVKDAGDAPFSWGWVGAAVGGVLASGFVTVGTFLGRWKSRRSRRDP